MNAIGTEKKVIFWLFLLVFSVYFLAAGGHYGGDALNNYLTTESMILEGDLSIYDKDFSVEEIEMGKAEGVLGKDGNRYSPFGIGMPILQIPFYTIGLLISKIFKSLPAGYVTFFCVSFTNTLLSALNSVLLFLLMLNIGFRRREALGLSIIYSFSTVAIIYSRTGFLEPAISTFMLITIINLFNYFKDKRTISLVVAGLSFGFMGLIKSYTVIFCPIFALFFLINEKEQKLKVLIPIASYILVASIELWTNYLRFGSLIGSGYSQASSNTNAITFGLSYGGSFFKALYYYWVSSGKGFFLYSPPLLIALFTWQGLFSERRKEFWFILSIILAYALYFAFLFKRGSIFSWGPRYLIPILPLFILFMKGVFKKKSLILLLIIMVLIGIFIQLPAIVMNYSHYLNFIIEKVGVDEYLINFIPGLSPVKGCWQLLISFSESYFRGSDYIFTYSPDPIFVKPIAVSMASYNKPDIWFINIVNFNQNLKPLVMAVVAFCCGLIVLSAIMLVRKTKEVL